jgi:uncharacterized cupredoxin-like copper-binding protein
MKCRLVAAAAVLALSAQHAAAGPGHAGSHHGSHDSASETAYGRPGDPNKPARRIEVVMGENGRLMQFAPERLEVRRGEQVRFVLRNRGELEHELVIGTAESNRRHAEHMAAQPDMAHDDANAKRLVPNAEGVLSWQFTKAGEFEYACLIPGHREAGMTGTILVK